jgi:hypothetical protein
MKNSRGLILIGGVALIGISIAFIFLVLPEVYRETTVGKLGMFHLIFAEMALLGTFAFMEPGKRNSADLPARLALPMMLGFYALIVAGVYAATPALTSTVATALHLVLAAGLVMLVVATFIAGGHAKAVQDEDEAAQQGYDLMLLAAGSVERALGENTNKSEISDVASQVTKLKEGIQYSDRGGVAATADIEQSIASGLRELGESLATLGADGVDDALATIRSLNAKLGERNDLLKLKK